MDGFVGRTRELDLLNGLLTAVEAGGRTGRPGKALLIRGRRRVGKSRLVEEFVERSGRPHVFFTAIGGSLIHDLEGFADVLEWYDPTDKTIKPRETIPHPLPKGAKMILLEGDPAKDGPFVMRVKMPDGFKIMPHTHPKDERVTVLAGTLYLGMGAKFDEMFANSSAETKTTTEKGFVEGFAKQVGDIGAIMISITVAVLFTMILVAANTMAQSVRERTSEVGVLKTLGFSSGSILVLVLSESVLIAAIGGGLGLLTAWAFVRQGDPTGGMLPIFVLPTRDLILGGALVVALGLLAGALPAMNAMNLKITDALRRA
jgi:hypothetical protein